MKNAKEEEGKYGTKYSFVPYFPPPLESECFDQKVREIDKLVVGFGKGMQVRVFWRWARRCSLKATDYPEDKYDAKTVVFSLEENWGRKYVTK